MPQLIHANLTRKGVQCFLSEYEAQEGNTPLKDRIAAVIADIDTAPLV